MAGFSDKLAAAKAKNAEAQERKAAEAAAEAKKAAAESARQEKLGNLAKLREGVQAELGKTENDAGEAQKAMAEADAYVKEQGDALDAEAKAEIDQVKAEAGEVVRKFESLKAELAKIDAEIAATENAGEITAEAKASEAQEQPAAEAAPAEQAKAIEATESKTEKTTDEKFAEKRQELLGAAVKGIEDIPDLSGDVKNTITEEVKANNRLDVSTAYSPDLASDGRFTKNERFPKLMQLMNPEIGKLADKIADAETKLDGLQVAMGPDGAVLINKLPADMGTSLKAEIAVLYKKFGNTKEYEEENRKLRSGKYAETLRQRIQDAKNQRGGLINDAKDLMKRMAADDKYKKTAGSLADVQLKWVRDFAKAAAEYQQAKREEGN
ncbi:MAG: hypothetical protein WC551_06820 [Patescibacteria group bacterium]